MATRRMPARFITCWKTRLYRLYYDRDRYGVPHGWIRIVKEAMRSCIPSFSARRMLKDYIDQMYIPAMKAGNNGAENIPSRHPQVGVGL